MSSALSDWREAFVRSCGKDPEQLRQRAAEVGRGRYQELIARVRGIDERRLSERTLPGNHELLATARPGASAGELRARIAMVTRRIQSVVAEIDWLQAEIEKQKQSAGVGSEGDREECI
jgi:hypothetical protein